jgi:hypothetical protein
MVTLSFWVFDEFRVVTDTTNPNGTTIGGKKEVHRITKDWGISSITWKAPWDSGGGDYDPIIEASNTNDQKGKWEDFDVTDLVKEFIDNPSGNYGFIVKFLDDPLIDFGSVSYSSEYSDISKRPKLTVYY